MHLLFVTSIVPDGSLGSGYEIANEAIIDALRRAGVRVTVIGFTWPGRRPSDPDDTVVLGAVDVRNEAASASQKLRWLGTALASGLTFASAKMRAIDHVTLRAAIASVGPFDAYVLNSVQLAGAFEDVFADKPSLFVAHNVEQRSALENAASAASPLQRLLFRREARLLAGLEARLCGQARFVFTLADEDRAALGIATPDKSATLPLVAARNPPPEPRPRSIVCDAGMIGTWTWQPNRVGLDWFLDAVVPHLPQTFRIRIAGGLPAGMRSTHPGVEFLGRVPDARDFVRSAALIPLVSRGGTGVQLKTIETFELGLPCVATSSALRGIGHVPDNCVLADDPAAFAAAMIRLAARPPRDLDGRAFHRAQLDGLDRAIAVGLGKLGYARAGVAA